MSTIILVVSAILVGIVALGAFVGWLTDRGRRARRRISARLRRRPLPPRTNVHIQPDRQFCHWSQADDARVAGHKHVSFQMRCIVTNLTPVYELRLRDVELPGMKGDVEWQGINSNQAGVGTVHGADLPPDIPVDAMLIVTLSREALPEGDRTARMIVTDHLGNRYRTPRVTFKDAEIQKAKYANPQKPQSPQPDLSDPLNRPPSGLPPKPPESQRP